ncbi:hypothetical protein [Streptomyces sp. Caat 7-52]|uniref:hypothetical protein n=1 Tax=Streptomyces sp. Caat 7-52 TaxID=2949637 RepID=UPI002034C2E9|nr:hypothetical protein [Streptomyces sp. Caat 7-52]
MPAPAVRSLRYAGSEGRLHEPMPMPSALGDRAAGRPPIPSRPPSDGVRDPFMLSCPAVLEQNAA